MLDVAISRTGIDPMVKAAVTVISSDTMGVCSYCLSGMGGMSGARPGPVVQFSRKYPNLTLVIKLPNGGVDMVVRAGVRFGGIK